MDGWMDGWMDMMMDMMMDRWMDESSLDKVIFPDYIALPFICYDALCPKNKMTTYGVITI